MEARFLSTALAAAALVACGAGARSQNFIVQAPTPQLAQEICQAAENYRRDLAIEWLGEELPPWQQPCPIQAKVHPQLGAGGATSFMFNPQAQPFGWTMEIQGSRERVLDSVLPHEVTHTIFATYFGRPLPRWADEGACTTVEHPSEKAKQEKYLVEFLLTNRGIAFNKMFAMKEYPPDILPLYSQGYSLARYFIQQGGKRKYVQFVGEGMKTNNWPAATRKYYGYQDLSDLQTKWVEWVRLGSPEMKQAIAQTDSGSRDEFSNASSGPSATLVAVQQSDEKVLGKNSLASNYAQPSPPTNLGVVERSNAPGQQTSNVGRPYSEGWYTKRRDQNQGTGSTPARSAAEATSPVRTIPNRTGYNQGAQTESPSAKTGLLAADLPERGALSASHAGEMRQVLLEWNRPTDKPWSLDAVASAMPAATPLSQLPSANPAVPMAVQSVTARPATITADLPNNETAWR